MGEGGSANAVELMAFCREERCIGSEHLHSPAIFHTPLLLIWIYLIDHLRIIDMHLIRIDSNDWAWIELQVLPFHSVLHASNTMLTVLIVHLLDLPGVSAALDNIVVEFIPKTYGSNLWSRNLGKRIEIQAMNIKPNDIKDEEDREQLKQYPRLHYCVA